MNLIAMPVLNLSLSWRKQRLHTAAGALLALLFISHNGAASAAPDAAVWHGKVSHVVDGDTIKVRPAEGGKPLSVRLRDIDAPEICQAGGKASREALKALVAGREVAVNGRHHDDYGRVLARITLDGRDVGEVMVVKGQAWSYRYRKNPGRYAAQQAEAEAARRGLFAPQAGGDEPVHPRDFRKQHGSCYR